MEQVVSDTELHVKAPGINFFDFERQYAFKVIPKLDQTQVYEAVMNRLTHG